MLGISFNIRSLHKIKRRFKLLLFIFLYGHHQELHSVEAEMEEGAQTETGNWRKDLALSKRLLGEEDS